MSEFNKVSTIEELNLLNKDEITEGYLSGLAGDKEPGSDKSKSFWHGWRNGRVDGKWAANPDYEQGKLARECIEKGYFKGIFNEDTDNNDAK